jgi:hypothetical protein
MCPLYKRLFCHQNTTCSGFSEKTLDFRKTQVFDQASIHSDTLNTLIQNQVNEQVG